MFVQFLFWLFAVISVVSGILVVSAKNPVTSALSLVSTLGAVAGLFVLLDAHFIATVQILVYAGAIMVLFVFVIMLLNHPVDIFDKKDDASLKITGILLATSGGGMLSWRFLSHNYETKLIQDTYGTIEQVGINLFQNYLIPFEAISLLLTAAVVGAVIIAKRDL